MNRTQLSLLVTVVLVITAYILLDGNRLLDPRQFQELYQESPAFTTVGFFLLCLFGTAFSLPVCGVLSIAAGIVFGQLIGIPLVLTACAAGGTLGFLASRYVLHDLVQRRFSTQLQAVNRGVEKEGAFYVFSLRMVPVIPFWLLNLLLGLTRITTVRFFTATLTGMVPVTVILVHFGTQIGSLQSYSFSDVFTPDLILSLMLLGALPFITKGLLALVQNLSNKSTN